MNHSTQSVSETIQITSTPSRHLQTDPQAQTEVPEVSWAPVAHACNHSYSEGRDQEDGGSKPAWANSLQDPILKNHNTKKGLVEWLKVKALCSNPRTEKKKTRSPRNTTLATWHLEFFCLNYSCSTQPSTDKVLVTETQPGPLWEEAFP
jgi:hypothetical protein